MKGWEEGVKFSWNHRIPPGGWPPSGDMPIIWTVCKEAVAVLEDKAKKLRVAYLCSEVVWGSCHRSLISNFLKAKGWKVTHIMSEKKEMHHPYTKPARIINGKLSYSAD